MMKNKSTLAKLMSEEDIFVVHKQMETAYFNSKSRELGLPIWKDEEMTPAIYDLMVGHEIGHALGLTHTEASEDIMYAFRQRGHIPSFFERYRNQVSRRADIRSHSAISDTDASRLRAIH